MALGLVAGVGSDASSPTPTWPVALVPWSRSSLRSRRCLRTW